MYSPEAEQSFRNIVIFYQKELVYIENGKNASDFFNANQRKKLVDIGVFKRVYRQHGCRFKLTNKTKDVLGTPIVHTI